MSFVAETKKEMQAALDHLGEELKGIRSGRASPGLVSGVSVEVYGSEMRLSDLANVIAPEARQLVITPYDANNVGAIAKGIEKAQLPVQVVAEGNLVRVVVPPMSEETRKDMVKQCGRKAEEGKVSIRNVRRKFNDAARKGDLAEDELKRTEKQIQDLTDDFCKRVDSLTAQKEKEILTV